jgi:hypothetical protein
MKPILVVLALVAACGKEETPTTPPAPSPGVQAPKAPSATPTDASKAALDKAIADTKALIEKKQADAKALVEKMKADPMNAAQYKAEADKLQKEITDLQAKLEGYMREAGQ